MKEFFTVPKFIIDVYNYEKDMEVDYDIVGYVSAFFGLIIYIVNFKNVDDLRVVIPTYLVGTAMFLVPIILKRVVDKKRFVTHVIIFIGVALTLYGLFGVNEGTSYLWSYLAIFALMIQFGMPVGLPWCTFFLVYSIVIFWTPIKDMLPYHYADEMAKSFPWMYMLDFIASFVGNLYYRKSCMEYDKQKSLLHQDLDVALEDIDQAMFDSIAIISTLIDEKDAYTKEHSVRVAKYSKLIAEHCGYAGNPKALRTIYNAAYLHDIGKVAVPDKILNNRQGLDDEQYEIMKKHTVWGADILKEMTFFPKISYGALYHHEQFDGKGYPNGVKGTDIPIEARIITVADALDAMNSSRVYRKACSREYILNAFKNDHGAQFDENIAEVVCQLIEEGKIKIVADEDDN